MIELASQVVVQTVAGVVLLSLVLWFFVGPSK